jgi:hypothetical protein
VKDDWGHLLLQSLEMAHVSARPPLTAGQPVHGLFINTTKAQCSIYQSGCMVHASIQGLDKFVLDYLELSQIDTGSLQ